uniref:uncharacterized protein isoform X1 n=1 Tax=Myxine glutinosa TaxID=7769 RepID=UPI00358F638D
MSGLVPRHGRLRVLVLGQSCVGKTAMIVRFLTGRFIGDYDPTLETVYKHSIKIDGDLVDFEIFDTAKEDPSLLDSNICWAEAFIVAFAVTNRPSFLEAMKLIHYLRPQQHSPSTLTSTFQSSSFSLSTSQSSPAIISLPVTSSTLLSHSCPSPSSMLCPPFTSSALTSLSALQPPPSLFSCDSPHSISPSALVSPTASIHSPLRPLLLVGTKKDAHETRVICKSEAEELAVSAECSYTEISSRDDPASAAKEIFIFLWRECQQAGNLGDSSGCEWQGTLESMGADSGGSDRRENKEKVLESGLQGAQGKEMVRGDGDVKGEKQNGKADIRKSGKGEGKESGASGLRVVRTCLRDWLEIGKFHKRHHRHCDE